MKRTAKKWWSAAMGAMQIMDERNVVLISAGVGFFAMLALFPGIAALISIWGLVADPLLVEQQLALLEDFAPAEALALVEVQLDTLTGAQAGALTWTTVISTSLSLWWSRSGVASLIRGLNAVYREDHRPNLLMRWIVSLVLTAALIGMVMVALTAVVVAPIVLALIPLGPYAAAALEVARWGIAAGVMVLGLGFVYRYGPNRRAAKVPWVSPGALIAVAVWAAGSWAFSLYLANFGRYNEVYGSLGAAVALLMWFYLSAYVTLMGAALNAELELRTLPDTTVGPPKPMGQRGAYVADTYLRP